MIEAGPEKNGPQRQESPASAPRADGFLTRERALAGLLVVLTVLAGYLCFRLVQPFLPAVAWALAFAVVARPLHKWIARRVRQRELAAALAVALVIVILLIPTLFVLNALAGELMHGAEAIRSTLENGNWQLASDGEAWFAPLLRWANDNFELRGQVGAILQTVAGNAASVLRVTFEISLQLVLTIFFLFYFFRDEETMLRGLRRLLPLSDPELDVVEKRVGDTIHATVYGMLVVSAIQGAVGGLMFWWLGLPAPVTWSVVMALLAVVPYLGAFVVWAPAAAIMALTGNWGEAAILTAWGVIAVGFVDNLVYPILVGNRLRLHTLLAFVALLGGIAVLGAAGIILGPVIAAATIGLVEVWRHRTAHGGTADSPKAMRVVERIGV